MRDLFSLSPTEITILATALSLEFSRSKDIKELSVIGNFLVSIGTNMLVIAAQQDLLESRLNPTEPPVED